MYRKYKVRGRRNKRYRRRSRKVSKLRKYRTRRTAKKALRSVSKIRAITKQAQYYHYYQWDMDGNRVVPLLQPNNANPGSAWNANPVFAQNPNGPNNQERVWHSWTMFDLQFDQADENEVTNHSIFLIRPTKYGSQVIPNSATYATPTLASNVDYVGTPGSIYLNPRLWKIMWQKHYQSGDHLAQAGGITGTEFSNATAPRKVHRHWRFKIKTNVILEQYGQSGVNAAWNNGGQPRYRWQNVYLVVFTDNSALDQESPVLTMNNLNQVTYL